MTGFKTAADQIVESEITAEIKKCGYVLENGFKEMMHSRYRFSSPTISGALERAASNLGLMRRHLTNELKNYYGIENSGHPVAYLPDEHPVYSISSQNHV